MSLSLKDALTQFIEQVVQVEVQRVLPAAANLVPGVPGAILKELLDQPAVQQKITDLETKGIQFLIDEAAKGFQELQSFVVSHVHGRLAQVVAEALKANPPALSLTADQVRQLAVLTAAGKLDQALQQALTLYGLLPAAS